VPPPTPVTAAKNPKGAGRAEHGDGGVVEDGEGDGEAIHGAAPCKRA
jgi:hypothetical protein